MVVGWFPGQAVASRASIPTRNSKDELFFFGQVRSGASGVWYLPFQPSTNPESSTDTDAFN